MTCKCVWAILLAGGVGSRVCESVSKGKPKQFIEVNGQSILSKTLTALLAIPELSGIVVVARAGFEEETSLAASSVSLDDNVQLKVVSGGELRQDSVFCGLKAIHQSCTTVWVHDGCRPFVDSALISRLAKASDEQVAVIPAVNEKHTLKTVNKEGFVVSTVDRSRYVEVQTPQVFSFCDFLNAHLKAADEKFVGTDCASVMEMAGHRVKVVEGSDFNIKVTTSEDVELAEFIDNRLS